MKKVILLLTLFVSSLFSAEIYDAEISGNLVAFNLKNSDKLVYEDKIVTRLKNIDYLIRVKNVDELTKEVTYIYQVSFNNNYYLLNISSLSAELISKRLE